MPQSQTAVPYTKYLRLQIIYTSWDKDIWEIIANATRMLGFLRRKKAFAPTHTKDVAYKVVDRLKLEHEAPIWHLYFKTRITHLEKVQRTVARWTCRRSRIWLVLRFNDTSILVGHFVSSPGERKKRDRRDSGGDEREGWGRKSKKSYETEEIRTFPLYP